MRRLLCPGGLRLEAFLVVGGGGGGTQSHTPLPPFGLPGVCLLFGEKEFFQQFQNPQGSWLQRAQEATARVALPLVHRPLCLLLPFHMPVHSRGES